MRSDIEANKSCKNLNVDKGKEEERSEVVDVANTAWRCIARRHIDTWSLINDQVWKRRRHGLALL